MTVNHARPSVHRRHRVLAAAALGSCLALAALFAGAAPAAADPTADGAAFGQRVDLTLETFFTTYQIESGPAPFVFGAGPPSYDLVDGVPSFRLKAPAGLGTLLRTGAISAEAASPAPIFDESSAAAAAADVALNLAGRLTLTAASVSAEAGVVPEDGSSCWGGTMNAGGAALGNAFLGGSLVPLPIPLPAAPEADYVALDLPGTLRVILNEQQRADGRLSVHAVHVEVIALAIPGVGTLRGDVYIGHADAAVGCGGADLGVTIAGGSGPATVGQNLAHTVTVANAGPERALATQVVLPLPSSVAPLSATPSQGSCTVLGRLVTCALGDLRAGNEATVVVTTKPVASGGTIVTADVHSNNDDLWQDDNHAAEFTLIRGLPVFNCADLSVSMVGSADPAWMLEPLVYTLTVHGQAPVPAGNVLLIDELPAGVELVSVATTQGQCGGTRTVVCDLGVLAVGQQAQVTITVLVQRGGTLTNTVAVSTSTDDPDVLDNLATVETEVLDQPSLAE